ncbi:MAG: protein TonB [Saprospiraceae bacterium]|jgi:protein TonB
MVNLSFAQVEDVKFTGDKSIEDESDEIFKVVDEMPFFPGCESETDKFEKKKCADTKMLIFIYKNVKYPDIAKKKEIEGKVIVRFYVERDGTLSNIEIARDIGGGCGEAALDVVKMMPSWNPGLQKGNPVRVEYLVPVKFKL